MFSHDKTQTFAAHARPPATEQEGERSRAGQSPSVLWRQVALQAPEISSPSDAHELEAERVADELVRTDAGEPQPGSPVERFESRLDPRLGSVRLHTGADAAAAAEAVDARAFTIGSDIVFGHGEFAPHTDEGRHLLAHELVHVVQQQSDAERQADEPEVSVSERASAHAMIHRRPAELIDNFVFLGVTVGGGLNETLRDRLVRVQERLQQVYDALGPNHADRVHFGGAQKTLGEWADVRSARAWRQGSSTSYHASGSAVDINYDLQPYIVTRTQQGAQTIYGGEAAGAGLQAERRAAAGVYDRAVQFVFGAAGADVSARRPGEATSAVYQRFAQTSRALSYYFRRAFLEEPTAVTRRPVANIEATSDADLIAAIPTTERRAEAEAVDMLNHYMDADWRTRHPTWTLSPRETYVRMLRDYEHVRIPMQRGAPSASPANTRNPTRGFLDLKQEVVEALVDVGRLRWGAADFGPGSSGDVHHFDLGNHGGVTPDGTP